VLAAVAHCAFAARDAEAGKSPEYLQMQLSTTFQKVKMLKFIVRLFYIHAIINIYVSRIQSKSAH